MEDIFLLFNFFNCERRSFWLRQIKVLLVVLTLASISSTNRRRIMELTLPNAMSQKPEKPHFDPSCRTCGISNEKNVPDLIINGTIVNPIYKYPWMVAVTKDGFQHCGGAIISKYFVLSAAHCVEKYVDQPDHILIGFLTDTRKLKPLVHVSAIYCHPQYDDDVDGLFDIALLRLQKKITCDKYKSPICLPRDNVILPQSTLLRIAGWGANWNKQYPDDLLEGAIKITRCKNCCEILDPKYCISGLVYCMKAIHDQAACFGDSGGPMFLRIRGKYHVMGITSYGYEECVPSLPFVYATVSTSRSWIRKVAGI